MKGVEDAIQEEARVLYAIRTSSTPAYGHGREVAKRSGYLYSLVPAATGESLVSKHS